MVNLHDFFTSRMPKKREQVPKDMVLRVLSNDWQTVADITATIGVSGMEGYHVVRWRLWQLVTDKLVEKQVPHACSSKPQMYRLIPKEE